MADTDVNFQDILQHLRELNREDIITKGDDIISRSIIEIGDIFKEIDSHFQSGLDNVGTKLGVLQDAIDEIVDAMTETVKKVFDIFDFLRSNDIEDDTRQKVEQRQEKLGKQRELENEREERHRLEDRVQNMEEKEREQDKKEDTGRGGVFGMWEAIQAFFIGNTLSSFFRNNIGRVKSLFLRGGPIAALIGVALIVTIDQWKRITAEAEKQFANDRDKYREYVVNELQKAIGNFFNNTIRIIEESLLRVIRFLSPTIESYVRNAIQQYENTFGTPDDNWATRLGKQFREKWGDVIKNTLFKRINEDIQSANNIMELLLGAGPGIDEEKIKELKQNISSLNEEIKSSASQILQYDRELYDLQRELEVAVQNNNFERIESIKQQISLLKDMKSAEEERRDSILEKLNKFKDELSGNWNWWGNWQQISDRLNEMSNRMHEDANSFKENFSNWTPFSDIWETIKDINILSVIDDFKKLWNLIWDKLTSPFERLHSWLLGEEQKRDLPPQMSVPSGEQRPMAQSSLHGHQMPGAGAPIFSVPQITQQEQTQTPIQGRRLDETGLSQPSQVLSKAPAMKDELTATDLIARMSSTVYAPRNTSSTSVSHNYMNSPISVHPRHSRVKRGQFDN